MTKYEQLFYLLRNSPDFSQIKLKIRAAMVMSICMFQNK